MSFLYIYTELFFAMKALSLSVLSNGSTTTLLLAAFGDVVTLLRYPRRNCGWENLSSVMAVLGVRLVVVDC